LSANVDSAGRNSAESRPPAAGGTESGSLEARAEAARTVLNRMENEGIERLERLRSAERILAEAARKKLTNAGRRAIRQIELDRQRLGRELHTGVGQMLTAIRLQVEIAETSISNPPPAAKQALERIAAIAEDALEQVRAVARRLHPPAWQRLTLDAALRQLCQMTGVDGHFETILRIQPLDFDPGVEVKSLFYRAAQEALSNVIRHSKATRIQLIFQQVRDRLVLQVRDNGVGFSRARALAAVAGGASAAPVSNGMGIESLRDEARALGGKLLIQSRQIGTTLEVSVRVHHNHP
jgi:two-component system, NarL family, sensor kinase